VAVEKKWKLKFFIIWARLSELNFRLEEFYMCETIELRSIFIIFLRNIRWILGMALAGLLISGMVVLFKGGGECYQSKLDFILSYKKTKSPPAYVKEKTGNAIADAMIDIHNSAETSKKNDPTVATFNKDNNILAKSYIFSMFTSPSMKQQLKNLGITQAANFQVTQEVNVPSMIAEVSARSPKAGRDLINTALKVFEKKANKEKLFNQEKVSVKVLDFQSERVPRKQILLLVGSSVGLILGALLIFLWEIKRPKVYSCGTLKLLKIPILGEISEI